MLAKENDFHIETDMFFMKDGVYQFDGSKIKEAHEWCRKSVEDEMSKGNSDIVVSNTFTQKWEMDAYFALAKKI